MVKYDLKGNKIPDKDLLVIIQDYEKNQKLWYDKLEAYYEAKNTNILSRELGEPAARGVPDNRIPVSYARKLVKTISGYLYKPGNIQYSFDGNDTRIRDLFELDKEPVKTSEIRKQTIISGIAYELHYFVKKVNESIRDDFVLIKPQHGFMIYDYSIDPNKIAFVRMYKRGENKFYDVYYVNSILTYMLNKNKNALELIEELENVYREIPVIEHRNNKEGMGDIEPILKLIDAYDVLVSDSLNEFDRFAWAYLLLTNDMDDDDIKNVKKKRIFADGIIDGKKAVDFLTKDINHEFIKYMTDLVKSEIHMQSFIPDLNDIKFSGAASGVSIDKFIYMIEYTCTDKEAYTILALRDRFSLYRNTPNLGEIPKVDIIVNRNTPSDDLAAAQIFEKYDGRLSQRTLIENYAPAVEDVDEELKRLEEEKEANQINFGFNEPEEEEETEEDGE